MRAVSEFFRRYRQKKKANKELGRTARGGEQGSSELHRKDAAKPYIHVEGSGAWVLGRVHDDDLKSTTMLSSFISTNEERHCWIIGATRSDKGVSQIIYNVLKHPGSQVVYDPKGEAYLVAAKVLAAKGKKVYLFDPLKKVARRLGVDSAPFETDFNPMLDIMGELGSFDPELPKRVSELATILMDSEKSGKSTDKAWDMMVKSTVCALLAYGLIWRDPEDERAYAEADENGTLTNQHGMNLIRNQNILIAAEFPSMEYEQQVSLLKEMAGLKALIAERAEEAGIEPIYPTVIDMIDRGAKTALRISDQDGPEGFNSILEMMNSAFNWVDSPAMKDHLRGFDFQFYMSMLKQEDDVVVFVVIPDTAFESHGAYLRMVFTSMVNACTDNDWGEGINPKRYKINAICDEVALWGYMPALDRIFKLGAGSGLRAVIVTQNKPMMDKLYGKDGVETFIDNSYQILLSGGGNETGAYFSTKAGKTKQRDKDTGKLGKTMVPLFEIDELWSTVHQERETSLLFENGKTPLLVRKVKYYEEAQSGLKKFIDYTPHPDHCTKRDQMLDPSVPRELLAHKKGSKDNGGKKHIQIGGGPRKRLESNNQPQLQ